MNEKMEITLLTLCNVPEQLWQTIEFGKVFKQNKIRIGPVMCQAKTIKSFKGQETAAQKL